MSPARARDVSAGGILLDRPLDENPRLAVIRRANDWSLPKGHVEDGETLEQAAAREVREETGYTAELLGLAGAMAYRQPDGKAKSVTYFYFLRRDAPDPGTELDGVASIRWLTFDEAVRRVSFDDLGEFIANHAPPGPPPDRRRPWERFLRLGRSVQFERLETAITMHLLETRGLRNRPRPHDTALSSELSEERASLWWRLAADNLLRAARSSASKRRVDAAWDELHSAQRLSLYELDDSELAARAQVLRAEAESKLDGWRRTAALAALDRPASWPPRSLVAAQEVLDQQSTNLYVKLRLASHRIIAAAVLLTITIGLLWLATALGAFTGIEVDGPFVLHDAGLFAGVLLLGMFGAMLSLSLDSSTGPSAKSRIYDFMTTRVAVPMARLAIGAGAAVLSVATVQAAVGANEPWVFLAAIPAGVSERLVRRSVETIESQIGK